MACLFVLLWHRGGWKGLRRTPFASLTTAPPTIYFVPLTAELVSCGPLPLPVSGGGHASAIPSIFPVALSQFHSRIVILPVAFSRLYSLGSILPLSSYRLLSPTTFLRYLPPTSILLSLSSYHIVIATRYLSPFRSGTL